MRPGSGPVTAAALRAIERNRERRREQPVSCRFSPSCSHYAEAALRERLLPVALLLIAWRLLRCNPLASGRVADPVRRTGRRLRPRPNTIPTALSILALSGFVVVVTAGVAEAVGVSGGCTATISGADPSTLTSDHPLVVHPHEVVSVTGQAASGAPNDPNNTDIRVDLIEGIGGVTSSHHPGHGPSWGGKVHVDKYLKYGVGLYHVTGHAVGSNWTCDGDGYVRLEDGNPLGKPVGAVAAGIAVLGAGGGLLSSRGGTPDTAGETPEMAPAATDGEPVDDTMATPESYASDQELRQGLGMEAARKYADKGASAAADAGCLVALAVGIFIGFLAHGGASAVGAMPVAAGGRRRIWAHGHPVLGFISGLFLGIGITVLMQQFAVWPLTIVTAIGFPLVTALIVAVRAHLGRAYRVG
ncbi:MAG: membrane protein insertion efficiency factor YidD [Frankiales bacterium]|nr:membrane protein insertion efficiency factor YidD [Frankiales bacterium]